MDLTPATFAEFRQLIHRLCGLVIPEEKAYLIHHRLAPLVLDSGCQNYEDFLGKIRGPQGITLQDAIIEAITTRETSFFRDGHPFEAIRFHILPQLGEMYRVQPGPPRGIQVRFWCTAVATGQEAYSLAMLVHDFVKANRALGFRERDFSILGTDISARALTAATAAAYDQRDLDRGLTPTQIGHFFEKSKSGWVVRPEVRRLVEFRRMNLLGSLAGLGPFSVILCRNVLIYFDEATRRRLCEQFAALIPVGGWLVLGSAENLYGICDQFESVRLGETLVYRKIAPIKSALGVPAYHPL
jgi:chemotaxis protein methyltransferase CheR